MGLLKPTYIMAKVTDSNLASIWKGGKRGLLVDADNTLLPFGTLDLSGDFKNWLDNALAMGFRIVVFTNNFGDRAAKIQKTIGLPIVFGWVKPFPWGMARALRAIGLPRRKVLLFGDQLFTDILGANLSGIDCVLVEPLAAKDSVWTGLMRKLERLFGRGR
jgi:HAD superfamily phosphatase (TIGR01668 family)